ncbi:MAG: efflux RND transporter permease subunit [Pseudomonadota bacterium]
MDIVTRFGLERGRFTVLMMALILFSGVVTYLSIPKRENPEITIRTAVVVAEFDGMAPARVENLIAIPMERKIREIGAVEDIETRVMSGEVLIKVSLFDSTYDTDVEDAWEDLRNKMEDVAAELPEGTEGPFVNTDYGDVSIATVAITGDGFSLAELEDVAEDLRTALFRVSGVSKVTLYGEQEERIWLEVDTRKLASIGVQIDTLLTDLSEQNVILPAGEIDADGTRIVLEANGDLDSVDEIRGVLTEVDGLSGYLRLSDLVDVRRGYVDPKEEPVFFNGRPAIVAAIEMSDDTDIQDLGGRLEVALIAFENSQPIGIALDVSTFQERNVTQSVDGALVNVAQTLTVVLIVMLLFLGVRPALVITAIVPFTICFALAAMGGIGVDVEQVSIAAVIISLGLLVDNGLVVVEDIDGRVKSGVDGRAAALHAGAQYAVPLGVASITTISAFVPMLLLEGVEGEFSFSLGAVVSMMLLGSWITALYVLPYLSVLVLRPGKPKGRADAAPRQKGFLLRTYGGLVRRLLPFGLPIMILSLGAVGFSATQMGQLKNQMFPYSERADLLIYMDLPKEAAISETERMALRVQEWLSDSEINPDVLNSTVYVGSGGPRFNLGLDPADSDPASAFFQVNTTSLETGIEAVRRARHHFIQHFPEARFRVTRLPQGGSESGIVEIEIAGPDAETLMAAGRTLVAAAADIPLLTENESDWGNKVLTIAVDIAQDQAREFGITSQDVSEVMEAYFSGTTYSVYREGDDQIPIVMRATEASRDSLEDLANLSIGIGADVITVDQVAAFRPRLDYSQIRRMNQVRQIIVSVRSDLLSAGETLARLQPTIDALNLGPAYGISIAGELQDSADVQGDMGGNMPIALGIMVAALVFQFNSMRRALVTLLTIPLIMIGAPYAMLAMGQPFSFFAMLGLMSLMGIIINNAIVLINQIDLDAQEMALDDAIVAASQARARPVILTSLTTICGLIPMALSGGALFEPMATIMIGGLLFASPITLILVPTLYRLLMRPRGRDAAAREAERLARIQDAATAEAPA